MKEVDVFLVTIKNARERKGISQRDMAKYLDISQAAYNSIESGKTSLKVETLFQIAMLLNIDLSLNPNNTEENSEEIDEKIDKTLKELAEEQQDLQEKFIKMSNKITKLYSLLQKKI
jgi:transcriptional regulator with XRE-family HTH domain